MSSAWWQNDGDNDWSQMELIIDISAIKYLIFGGASTNATKNEQKWYKIDNGAQTNFGGAPLRDVTNNSTLTIHLEGVTEGQKWMSGTVNTVQGIWKSGRPASLNIKKLYAETGRPNRNLEFKAYFPLNGFTKYNVGTDSSSYAGGTRTTRINGSNLEVNWNISANTSIKSIVNLQNVKLS